MENYKFANCLYTTSDNGQFKCKKCSDFQTNSLSNLKQHFEETHPTLMTKQARKRDKIRNSKFDCTKSDLEQYACHKCNNNFRTFFLINLKMHCRDGHTVQNTKQPIYKCTKCKFESYSKFAFIIHKRGKCALIKNKAANLWYCEHCSFKSKRSYNMKNHVLIRHTPGYKIKWLQCEHCPFKARFNVHLRQHVKYKHIEPKVKAIKWHHCDHCSFKAQRKSIVRDHIVARHIPANKWLFCERCPEFKTHSPNHLKRHKLQKHTPKEQGRWYECAHCSYRTRLKPNLVQHLSLRHSKPDRIKWFACSLCPLKSKDKRSIKRHEVMVHKVDKNRQWYKCEQCPYKTERKTCLQWHELGHKQLGPSKPFSCEHCSYSVTKKQVLESHQATAHGLVIEKKCFRCANCSYKAKSKGDLELHCKDRHSLDLYCYQCSYVTRNKDLLRRHIQVKHLANNVFHHCDQCDFKTPYKSNITRHMTRNHPPK